MDKKQQLLAFLKNKSPLAFLKMKMGNGGLNSHPCSSAFKQVYDKKANLPNGVMNILTDFVIKFNNNEFNTFLFNELVSELQSNGIVTTEDAIDYVKEEVKSGKWASKEYVELRKMQGIQNSYFQTIMLNKFLTDEVLELRKEIELLKQNSR